MAFASGPISGTYPQKRRTSITLSGVLHAHLRYKHVARGYDSFSRCIRSPHGLLVSLQRPAFDVLPRRLRQVCESSVVVTASLLRPHSELGTAEGESIKMGSEAGSAASARKFGPSCSETTMLFILGLAYPSDPDLDTEGGALKGKSCVA